ncbi:bifunctional pyr operon transcriptional regulator/uracil phosphoribosyltransferase PyrR [bacterium]|nr:bifunctional pyr operon transcriptional regulator/uracil phosphoribosyltransferase PyrR [bacterium]
MTTTTERRQVHSAEEIDAAMTRFASEIRERFLGDGPAAIVGIRTRGLVLARRLHAALEQQTGAEIPFGTLDITLYRDDLSTLGAQPIVGRTDLAFPVDEMTIVLVDDVIYSGRTTRAAIDALLAYGRPSAIRLVVLADRGHREYPIQPDVVGFEIPTTREQIVRVNVRELDGADGVDLVS